MAVLTDPRLHHSCPKVHSQKPHSQKPLLFIVDVVFFTIALLHSRRISEPIFLRWSSPSFSASSWPFCSAVVFAFHVGNGASEGHSVSSLYKPCSLPLKDEKIEFEDLQAMGRPKEANVKRLMLEKQNKVEAAKINNEISPVVSPAFDRREVPSEVVYRAAASLSKNPAFIRALAIIKEDLKLLQDLNHKKKRRG